MRRQDFIAELKGIVREQLQEFTAANPDCLKLIYATAADIYQSNEIPFFEDFIVSPGFQEFLEPRLHSSRPHLEDTLIRLFKRIAVGTRPPDLAWTAGEMSTPAYRKIERSFYIVPVDAQGFRLFEKSFMQLAEQNRELTGELLEFYSTEELASLRQSYNFNDEIWRDICTRLTNHLLAVKTAERMRKAAKHLSSRAVMRFVDIAWRYQELEEYLLLLFEIIRTHEDPALYIELTELYSSRYPMREKEREAKREEQLFHRLKKQQEFYLHLPRAQRNEYREFLKIYGNPGDDFSIFVWDVVFELEGKKAAKALVLFISSAFQSIQLYYSGEVKTLKLLVKKLVSALLESDIREFNASLFPLILKLLLGLKLEKNFLKRRADFFDWLKSRSRSRYLELEVIRLLFFEYIFIAIKAVKVQFPMKMTKHADETHAFFCKKVDAEYGHRLVKRKATKDQIFEPLLERLRNEIWTTQNQKFNEYTRRLAEIRSVAETMDQEDQILEALEEVEPEHLEYYHESLMEAFRRNPDLVAEALQPDYWNRVVFSQALPHAQGAVFPLAGTAKIYIGDAGAYTDGRSIYLPEYVSYFRDPPEPLMANRNLTVYVGLALHEIGHLICGSFVFDYSHYMLKLEKPWLFKFIHNLFEDYRIEEILLRIKAHPQIQDILVTLNEYYAVTNFQNRPGFAATALFYINDEACGYNRSFKDAPGYLAMLESFAETEINTGRFSNLPKMLGYGVSRLQHMNVGNPLAAFQPAREFYEIMKHWPDSMLREMQELAGISKGGHHRRESDESDEDDGERVPRTPLTREELENLYREYDENPQAFLNRFDLPAYPELVPGAPSNIQEAIQESLEQANEELLSAPPSLDQNDYAQAGTVDYSHRTKADDEAARRQTEKPAGLLDRLKNFVFKDGDATGSGDAAGSIPESEKKTDYVYSIDAATGSRTRLSHIREYKMEGVNSHYMKKFEQWEYLSERVHRMLAALMPAVDERLETSLIEGDLNMELLIEILSDPQKTGLNEYLDVFREERKSLEIVIGLDASYSTDLITHPIDAPARRSGTLETGGGYEELDLTPEQELKVTTILDVEKAFAMIFGRAVRHLTDRLSIYAFNSVTSTNIYKAENIDAVSCFTADCANRDGDFIRYIKNQLDSSDADVKYFFLISDGQPAADNYFGKEALDDTLIAMRETVNAGNYLFYFNVDSVRGEYFDLFKQEATFAEYFNQPEDLLPAIPGLIKTVVNSIK